MDSIRMAHYHGGLAYINPRDDPHSDVFGDKTGPANQFDFGLTTRR